MAKLYLTSLYLTSALPLALLAACGGATSPAPSASGSPAPITTPVAAATPPPPHAGDPSATAAPTFIAADLVRRQWARADNRRQCAPIAFTDDGGAKGVPRRADFAGGWAVAFDLPGVRSAYGVAGPGLIPIDDQPPYRQTRRLMRQWPAFRELDALQAPSFAGYGLVGAKPYRADNPGGEGDHSLAYVRIHGQTCTYNVWSRISRAHLEVLLDGLRLLPPA
ncbi:hypothetical protein [Sphingomonas sp.]|uniref:hypothetical protein n=1 Tax=Sphingomonas sp. TaxID=28214 RepID=UPI001ED3A501|nr:hypothetical protein [Sphingomonas sp.]MBX3595582.1 hypothetical protein [Sphingomonas sp.]